MRCRRTTGALWALRTWLDSWAGIGHVAVGMHRQGCDLQLTQYAERGWRATTFYTDRDGALAYERHWDGMGAHNVARDPTGGVGGVTEGGNELTGIGSNLGALELPRGIAALVEMKLVYPRCCVRTVELEFDLHLDMRHCFATYRAGLFASRSAGDAVIISRGQFSSANCCSGPFTQRLIGHCPSSPEGANSIAFSNRMLSVAIGNSGKMFGAGPPWPRTAIEFILKPQIERSCGGVQTAGRSSGLSSSASRRRPLWLRITASCVR